MNFTSSVTEGIKILDHELTVIVVIFITFSFSKQTGSLFSLFERF